MEGQFSTAASDLPCDVPPEYPKFSIAELIEQGKLLLASSGKEFIKPTGILASAAEVKKARKEAMSRLGLEFLDDVADDMDLDKELTEQMEAEEEPAPPPESRASSEMAVDTPPDIEDTKPPIPEPVPPSRASSSTPSAAPVEPDPSTLSARERNRLKRKRKPGNAAFVAPPPQSAGSKYAPAVAGASGK